MTPPKALLPTTLQRESAALLTLYLVQSGQKMCYNYFMKELFPYKIILAAGIFAFLGAGCQTAKTQTQKPDKPPEVASSTQTSQEKIPPFVPAFSEPGPVVVTAAPVKKPSPAKKSDVQASTTPDTLPGLPANCGSNYDCYDQYYRGLIKKFGTAKTFAAIKEQYKTNSYVQTQCHSLTHIIGQAAAALYTNTAEAFAHGDEFCASGYFHGVMEAIIYKVGRENLPNKLNELCAEIPGKERYSLDYYNCNHGLGHGLMGFTNNELFDSLNLCDKLTGQWEQSSCYSGVFMENVIADFRNHFTKYLHPEDPMYPCGEVDAKYKQPCYLIQSSYALKVLGGDFKKTFEVCEKADSDFHAICFQSIGRDASGWSVSNVALTKSRCELGKDYFEQSNCVIGAVKDFVWHFHSDQEGYKLCDALNADLKEICRSTAKSYYDAF